MKKVLLLNILGVVHSVLTYSSNCISKKLHNLYNNCKKYSFSKEWNRVYSRIIWGGPKLLHSGCIRFLELGTVCNSAILVLSCL